MLSLLLTSGDTVTDFLQGFNTGVALYHLGRMRESSEYSEEVDVGRMRQLSHKKYLMPGTVGDQVRILIFLEEICLRIG